MAVEEIRQSPMMGAGERRGHRALRQADLRDTIVARYFVDNEGLVGLLAEDTDESEREARALVQQVEEKGYNSPRRERILQWQAEQEFEICPTPDDPDSCNVYNELTFPDELYQDIEEYREEKSS